MTQASKFSFFTSLALIFLLPVFFIPSQYIPLGIAKVSLVLIAVIVVFVSIIRLVLRDRKISLPSSLLLWGALVLPLVYLVSALGSSVPKLSLFGYALEPGTTASIVLLSILFFGTAYIFRDHSRLIRGLSALFISLSLVALFTLVKVLTGGSWFVWNTFAGNMGNPVGAWTDLAIAFGLLSVLTLFAIEMLPLRGIAKTLTWVLYVVSVLLLIIVNFSTAWMLVLGSSIVLLVYFSTVERREDKKLFNRGGVLMASVLIVLALIFVFDPSLGGNKISARVAQMSGVSNSEVRPNLRATFNVTKQVLSQDPVLGSGPNTFDRDWLLFKAPEANTTPFWNIAFPFGYGFLPTAVASTGLLGTVAWILFFLAFLMLGIKALSRNPESKSDRFILVSTFLTSLFLWVASFIYSPSIVVLGLAFISTGLLVGASEATGVIGTREIVLNQNRLSSFASSLGVIVLIMAMAAFSVVSVQKVLAASYFQKALIYSNTPGKTLDAIESELGRAISTSPADPYWSAVSQVELSRANAALNSTTGTDDENRQAFQDALSKSIAALQSAIQLNPNYQNWIALGNLYDSLVPPPLSVAGTYEIAQSAYKAAAAVNPTTPEVALLNAKLELDNKNVKAARDFIAEALAKKPDYADAYFLLSQLEVNQNNLTQAIKSAETGVVLSPGNPGVLFQLGLLKFSNKNYNGAVDAFTKALAIVSDYANAKYYLGISLDKLGRKAEAMKQFEDLAKSNPDNEAVAQVLRNLKAGHEALYQAPAETTSSKPPISGQ